MKLVSYSTGRSTAVGAIVDDRVMATRHTDMLALIQSGPAALEELRRAVNGAKVIDDARLIAPVPTPGKLLFCGVNYTSHQEENPAAVLPTVPFFFSKLPSAVIGPDDFIAKPAPDSKLDYEVELAVIIGRQARNVRAEDALGHVFGYTVVNDVSARDVQFTDSQITLGKGADSFCPMGPALVTADEISDLSALMLTTRVNGELRQEEGTANQIFSVAHLISFLSETITLEPGDIVSTGTPAGVGHFRTPPRYLAPGDVVDVSIEGIGTLSNQVIAGWEARPTTRGAGLSQQR